MISELIAAAWQRKREGDFAEADQLFRQVLQAHPGHGEALRALGGIAFHEGRYDEAIRWLRQALAGGTAEAADPILHSNLGAAYRAAGNHSEALACYRQALRLKPDFAEGYNNLANVLAAQGCGREALARYRQAVLYQPAYAEAHINLGLALLGQDTLDEAEAHLREAFRLQPGLAKACYGLDLVKLKQAKLEEAAACFKQSLDLQPSLADAHFQLGQILRSQGQVTQALPHLIEALRLQTAQALIPVPSLPDATVQHAPRRTATSEAAWLPARLVEEHIQQGLALEKDGKLESAMAAFLQAVQINPDSALAQRALGRVLEKQGRFDEAVTAFLHAARIEPERAETYLGLGRVLREQAHLDRAVGCLREALRLQPASGRAFCELALALTDQGLEDEAEQAFREALRLQPKSVAALSHLGILLEESGHGAEGQHFLQQALTLDAHDVQVHVNHGVSLVNQGRFEEARDHFLKAIALQPGCAAAYFFLARDVKHTFSEADIHRMSELLLQDSLKLQDRVNLHFALARVHDKAMDYDTAFHHCEQGNSHKQELLKRQGHTFDSDEHTRLVDRLIAAFTPAYFADVRGFGSASDLPVFIVGMPRSGTTLVEQILASHPDVFGAGETRNIKRLLTSLPAELSTSDDYPECLGRLGRESSVRIAENFLQRLRQLGGEKNRVVDKLPMNYHHLGLIATLFPKAQIIHCRRDARDVGWSCHFQNFREIYFASDLGILGAYQREYDRLMVHWARVLPVPIFDVCYEDLVENLEGVSRALVAFCGLPWRDRCLTFYETTRVVRTSSNFQVRRPVYRSSVGYWRHYERHLGALLEALEQPKPA